MGTIKRKLNKPLGVNFDKLTILGNVDDIFVFECTLVDLGFELQSYVSGNYGYSKVYKHELPYMGYIEIKQEENYTEPDAVRLQRNMYRLHRQIELVQEGKAMENMPTLDELNSSLEDVQALMKQCDERGYLKKVVRKDVRFEYNPKYQLYEDGVGDIQQRILSMMREKHCTRIDIAIDYAYKLSTLMILDKKRRKEYIVKGVDKRLETMYVGARSSNMQLCIYDKKQENSDKGTLDQYRDVEDVARFEARLKGAKTIEKFMNDDSIDPFEALLVLGYRNTLKQELDYEEEAVLEKMLRDIKRGLNPFERMTKRKKVTNRKILEDAVQEKLHVSKDYKEKRRFLVGQLENVLSENNDSN